MRANKLLPLLVLLVAASACAAGGDSAAPPRPGGAIAAPAPAPDAPATAAAVAPTRITLAYSTASAANSPLQLAQDQGIFRANGLEVEMIHAVGNAGPAAIVSGQAQVLSSGCAEALGAMVGGADFLLAAVSINRMQYVLAGGPASAARRRYAASDWPSAASAPRRTWRPSSSSSTWGSTPSRT